MGWHTQYVFLAKLPTTEGKVGVELPVLVSERCAYARIGDGSPALHWGEVGMIVRGICHETCADGEVQVFVLVVNGDGWLCVEVLG